MGTGRGAWIPLWIPMLVIALTHHQVHAQYEDQQSQYYDQQSQYDQQQSNYDDYSLVQEEHNVVTTSAPSSPDVTIIPPERTTLAVKAGNPAHNGQVCSTWGNFHFKTFDGDIYHFPGLCNYVFASHCKSTYEDFNIQIRRTVAQNATVISRVVIKIEGAVIELKQNSILVNEEHVQLPFSQSGILIERSTSGNVKIIAKLGLLLIWNQEDNLLLELNEKYANQTCGLCGDFNGIPIYNEFIANNIKLTPVQFGNLQKMDGPTEQCQDAAIPAPHNCSQELSTTCQTVLTGKAFMGCNELVEVQSYIDACVQDQCSCDASMTDFCICNTFAEYSRQCAHSGGQPLEWRTQDLCAKPCPFNMQHRECGSPCSDTCTNPERSQLCEEHCTDGCFCPPGTVYDDINNSGCVPVKDCHCTYNGDSYAPGASFASQCISCTCTGGQWTCVSLSCPGICSIEGGSHISTFDEKSYSVFGDCSYVFTKLCDSNAFTVLGEMRKCGLTDTETCLKGVAVSIDGGQTIILIKPSGVVYVNMILTQLPISTSNVTMFRPSTFFIILDTKIGFQVEIQLVPLMQVFVRLDPTYKGQTCGLCGNFNNVQTDDFKTISGVVEGTSAAFANTWKTQADCPNVKNIFENPCTLSIENEKYAQHWCGLLTDSKGPFQKCHAIVNPAVYHTNCMFDTCNCERSEDCMCAALSSYVRACAAKGILLSGWRTNICTKYQACPKTLTYRYNIDSCQPTCRSLSEPDVTCNIKFTSVDGCTCEEGTYMDESGKCIPATSCPCYYKGSPLPSGDVIHENGVICTCTQGKLQCIGQVKPKPVCDAPMIYFDCGNATAGASGAECQKSCQTLDMGCYSTQCTSGCMCPNELVSDGKGGCVAAEECPCIHNEATYNPGDTIKVKCNTCTCKNRMWECTNEPCLATCSVYGDGHYISFDGKRYSFSGDCEYTLVQDHCGKNSTKAGTFRVITENIPCGTTGTTCSKAIKVFLGNYELILTDGKFEVIQRVPGGEVPYKVRYMGIYMVVDTTVGLILMWDTKTSIFIKLTPEFKGHVCGLCGNYDGNDINDFTTRSQSVVGDVLEFGNSWKASPTCPDAKKNRDPCTANPYRNSWAQKQCSIITSQVFASCHSQVEPTKYYDACVSDACACDTGGDCECFCTAVAAYAQACNEAGVCVAWRTPSICPLFCDYYNPRGECEWHYKPCGSPCMKTCRNPSGKCLHELQGLEGCYPQCPSNTPYFDEDDMECVQDCGCFDHKGKYYKPGTKMPSKETCQSCECTTNGQKKCVYSEEDCYCIYEGKISKPGEIIYNTTDGIGGCITAICSHNGTIERKIFPCPASTTASTTFVFSTTPPATTTPVPTTTSVCVQEVCRWSRWYDVTHPGSGSDDGDFDTFDNLKAEGYKVCKAPKAVECRAEKFPNTPLSDLGQKVECSKTVGLICYNADQHPMSCHNYQIRILCCSFVPCGYSTTPTLETTMGTTTPATIKSTTTLSTTLISTTTVPEKTSISVTTPKSTSTSTGTTIRSTIETLSPTTEPTTQTTCKPKCKWTEWFDIHFPSLENKGDFETYDLIKSAGKEICKKPESIKCRAEKFPEKSIDEIGQIVQCNVSFGFVCRNEDQSGVLQMCFNYQIKVYCCENYCETTTPETTAGTTISATTTLSTTTPETTSTSVLTTRPQTTATTGSIETTTVPSTTEHCSEEVCEWSQWYDISYPGSAPDDGDFDTFKNIRAKGYKVCKKPKAVECRAERYPNTPLNKLEQKVICSKTEGLICHNKDQFPVPICYNYEIRIECCKNVIIPCPTTTQLTTTKPVTTPATTTTAPTTTITETSTTITTVPETTTTVKPTKPTTTVTETTTTAPKTTVPETSTTVTTTAPTTTVPETTTTVTTTAPTTTVPETTTTVTTTTVPETTTTLTTTAPTTTVPETTTTVTTTTVPETTTTVTTTAPTTTVPETTTTVTTTAPTTTVPETTTTVTTTTVPETTTTVTTTTPITTVPETTTTAPMTTVPETTTTVTTTTPTTTGPESTTTAPTTTVPETTTTVTTTTKAPMTTVPETTTTVTTTTPMTTVPETTTTAPMTTVPETTTTVTTTIPTTTVPETTTTVTTTTVPETTTTVPTTTPTTTVPETTTTVTTTKPTTTVPETTTTVTTTTPTTTVPETTTTVSTTVPETTTTVTTTPTTTVPETTTTVTTTTVPETTTTVTTTAPTTTVPETTTTVTTTTVPETTTTVTTTTPTTTLPETTTTIPTTVPESTTTVTTTPTTTVPETTTTVTTTTVPETTKTAAMTTPTTTVPETTTVTTTTIPETTTTVIITPNVETTTTTTTTTVTTTTVPETTTTPKTTRPETTTIVTTTTPMTKVSETTTVTTTIPTTTTIPETTTTVATTTIPETTTRANTVITKIGTTSTQKPSTQPQQKTTTTELTTTTSPRTCAPICTWSKWFDVDFPTSGPTGGDMETYNNIRAAGGKICAKPSNIQCRAENHPDLSIEQVGQNVDCDVKNGLVCENDKQGGKSKQCLNYEIRVLCCVENVNCQTTAVQTTTAPQPTTTVTEPTTTVTTTTKPVTTTTAPLTTTTETTTTTKLPSPTAPKEITTTSPTTTPLPSTTTTTELTTTTSPRTCAPICTWSKWFDVDFPTSGPTGGDMETYNNIRAAGGKICAKPSNIQCRAENHPDLSIEQVGQNVDCDVKNGLVCENDKQGGKSKQCLNYEIRVLCCVENVNCQTTAVQTTTAPQPTTTVTEPTTTVITTTKPVTTTTAPLTTTTETTTTTKLPSPTAPKEITTSPTTTPLPSTTTTTELTTTTSPRTCAPICTWSKWFDVDFPTSGPTGGDMETYNNIRAAGGKICAKPSNIQCRAENHPDLSIEQVGQNVDCDVKNGLVCENDKQGGKSKQCLNYEIRVLCCVENVNCQTTAVQTTTAPQPTTTVTEPTTTVTTTTKPVTTTTAPLTTTTETTTTTKLPSPTAPKEITTTSPTTTPLPSTTTTTELTTTTSPRTCAPICTWSKWFDVDIPTSGPTGGDMETYNNIRAAGGKICAKPSNIQCRAENHPDLSIEQVGQNVDCDVKNGLVCENDKQGGKSKQCLNYEIRVLCCVENVNCQTTAVQTTTAPQPMTTVTEPTTTVTTTTKPVTTTTAPLTTTTETTTTTKLPSPTAPKEITTTSPTTTPLPSTTTTTELTTTTSPRTCAPICTWSKWFDVDFPTSGPTGGDMETYNNIRAAGGKICAKPSNIQCRAENHPDLSIEQVGQNVDCDVKNGLVCENDKQGGKSKQCLNYEIRVLCCVENVNCQTTAVQTTTAPQPTTTVTEPTTTVTTTTKPVTTTTAPLTTTTETTTTTKLPSPTAPKEITTSPTTTPLPSTTTTTELTTTTSPRTCAPICTWSKWFDVDFPTSGPTGGDMETYNNIRAAGGKICAKPSNIQCRAENHPDLSIEQVGQNVDCDVKNGLVCENDKQGGKSKQCLNYEIRVLCCVENVNCQTTAVQTTTAPQPMTTVTEPTTTVTTTTKPVTTTTAPLTTTTETTTTTKLPSPTAPKEITTTSPTTTPLPSTTTTTELTTTTSPRTCAPICTWSKWFDVDFPTSGPTGGDMETYNNIRAAGGKICAKPSNIQCRAENHPDLSIEQVGQNVDCDVKNGLVCENDKQGGKSKQCLNYEIRVLCCVENVNCQTTTVQTTTTTEPTTTVTEPTTTIVTPLRTTACFCKIGENVYPPGGTIYTKTDYEGCLFYAICNKACAVERFKGPCKSTTPQPTTTIETTPVTVTTVGTTRVPGCPDATPPRKEGETWVSNCTKSTCEGNNKIVINQVKCPSVRNIVCENGYPPVKVFSDDGCCYHYECECVCSGWGDPHYITFDGTYYTFLDNCTYVLVQQIVPKYGNFRVLIDNYFCNAEDGLSCPHSIIIYYNTAEIVLTREFFNGAEANKIYFNKQIVNPGFQKDGISISMLGINMMVNIPEIGATITFSGLIFSIKLPYSKFGNNTEGQCGTCTNDRTDECRLPSGVITDCPHMAPYWRVPDDKKQYCFGPPPTVATTPTPSPTCKPSTLCQMILSDVFAKCHDIIPPKPFYQGCNFDACYITNTSMQCSGLEIYASLCASKGICIDWRAKTNGACPFVCPKGKIYEPCGSLNPLTCDTKAILNSGDGITEGCYCPTGTKLFNAYSDVCVSECSCVGPDGMPRAPGSTWISNCQDCSCEKYSLTVQCKPKTCVTPAPVPCTDEGYVPVTVTTVEDPCCPHKKCMCNTTYCPKSIDSCPLGYELKQEKLPGDCCTKATCVLLPGCVVSNVFYQPGAVVPRGSCELCKCSLEQDIHNELYTVECISKACNTTCPEGYAYKEKAGQCCGECTPVACILKEESSEVIIQPGETWHYPGNKCISYECEHMEDKFVLVTVKRTCPALLPGCPPEDVRLSDDGCCKICYQEVRQCMPRNTSKVIRHNGCEASSPIQLRYCEGNCGTSSKYSSETNAMEHTCQCCQEVKTSKQQVALKCPDGSIVDYSYIQVEECDCLSSQCAPQPSPTQSEQQQQEEQQQQQQQEEQQQGQIQK